MGEGRKEGVGRREGEGILQFEQKKEKNCYEKGKCCLA